MTSGGRSKRKGRGQVRPRPVANGGTRVSRPSRSDQELLRTSLAATIPEPTITARNTAVLPTHVTLPTADFNMALRTLVLGWGGEEGETPPHNVTEVA
jgi:hypothetical protein